MPYTKESLTKFSLSGEIIVALFVVAILIVLFIIIGILARKADFRKKPKGLLLLAEIGVEKVDGMVAESMGKGFENFGGLLFGLIPFLFLSFTFGIMGLPTPMANISVPLCFGITTFFMIHYSAVKFQKAKYFKRYVDPFAVFLPINLLSMWAPLLSITLRLFGNAVVGWVLMSLVNWALEGLGGILFGWLGTAGSYFLIPVITPVLHAYFDLFSGFIQTVVYAFLTMLLVSQEKPAEYEAEKQMALAVRKEK